MAPINFTKEKMEMHKTKNSKKKDQIKENSYDKIRVKIKRVYDFLLKKGII